MLFDKIWKLFQKPTKQHLNFSPAGLALVRSHLKNPGSGFYIHIVRDKFGEGKITVGIDSLEHWEGKSRQIKIQGIPCIFPGYTYEILEGARIEVDSRDQIYVFPELDLIVENTPNPNILRFTSNKKFISDESEIREGYWENAKSMIQKSPRLIQILFKEKGIRSIALMEKSIQIEWKNATQAKKSEQKAAEIILEYLETLPEPIRLLPIRG
jgi:hypothetical protein